MSGADRRFGQPRTQLSTLEQAAANLLAADGWSASQIDNALNAPAPAITQALQEERFEHIMQVAQATVKSNPDKRKYSIEELRDAFRTVEARADVRELSARYYKELKDDDHPNEDPFVRVFGSWPAARVCLSAREDIRK